jgi:hypothetical protein
MKKNTLMILCLVLALLVSLCGCAGEKEEAYRMIQVLEVSGTVSVERPNMGVMDVYEGMRWWSLTLLSGWRLQAAMRIARRFSIWKSARFPTDWKMN